MLFKKNKKVPIELDNLPKHVAFIMDGNGRWAKKRGLPRLMGHNAGMETLKRIVIESKKLGLENITFYAFSTENWSRPAEEVNGLMDILVKFFRSEIDEIIANKVKINIFGDVEALPQYAKVEVLRAVERTQHHTEMNFNIALNYGGRDEILRAVRQIAMDFNAEKIALDDIDETLFSNHLFSKELPDPDLLIRTSGEQRLSNFMLWQVAYTEFVFDEHFWPDFDETLYRSALIKYQKRHRRFGAI
ncbi:isoprenyl transferase [Fusibacter ferrireducens]|uniref:Isoprenyl transferase n=1 Tax=Fusibacter ferrireducens TaxID=2785058 RepID=A0ABR9ZN65_9FIRM|nr:isoprenyl transferase [Fusibacter ferrireducens]MBF4691761.1 isoprenyl transferase [Fusibacter ferrireducens]